MNVNEIAAFLRSTPVILHAQLSALNEAELSLRPAAGEWSVKETIGHLIETDRTAFAGRIKQMLDEDEPLLGGMDVHGLVERREDNTRPLEELLDELKAGRSAYADLVAGLSDADMQRVGHYPKLGKLRVSDFVYEWPYHDSAHIAQIQHALQPRFLEGMGSTMRRAVSP